MVNDIYPAQTSTQPRGQSPQERTQTNPAAFGYVTPQAQNFSNSASTSNPREVENTTGTRRPETDDKSDKDNRMERRREALNKARTAKKTARQKLAGSRENDESRREDRPATGGHRENGESRREDRPVTGGPSGAPVSLGARIA